MQEKSENLLSHALKTAKPVFLYMGLFSFFINLLLLFVPIYSLQVLDRVLSTGSMETLFWLSAIMVAAFLAAAFLQSLRSFSLIRAGEWMDSSLSSSLLSTSLTHAASTGIRGTQNLRDLTVIKNFLAGNGLLTLFDAPWAVISLLVIFLIHMQLGVITLLGCLLLLGIAWLNEIAMHKPLDEANEINVRNLHQVDIAMRNAEVIEAMGMTPAVTQRWRRANHKVSSLQSQASYRSAVMQAFTRFARLVLQIAITGWGAYLALHHEMTAGGIIAASILAGKALAPFEAAIGIWKSLVETRKSYHRLHESLDNMAAQRPGISLPAPEGSLLVEKLIYAVPGKDKPVLRSISFDLSPGDTLGIIGPSAAGKSTLAKLIVGSWKPTAGTVRLDGGDVRQWKREEFGRHVGYLPQDIELFSGSVKDNISRMLLDATDESIVCAAQMAGAHELIMGLPEGYDTDIGNGGSSLSAGQRQRIGLARALYGNPKLLVLDEPDASLDNEGEQQLAMAIQKAKAQRTTTVVITHRRALLHHVNKLLVLREGEVFLFGPTQDVLAALTPPDGNTVRVTRPRVAPTPRNPISRLPKNNEPKHAVV